MLRLLNLRVATASRLNRVVDLYLINNHNNNSSNLLNGNLLTFKRCLSSNGNSSKSNADLHKSSTTKGKTHVPNDLKVGQSTNIVGSSPKSTTTVADSGKFWSAQSPGSENISSLNSVGMTHVPTSTDSIKKVNTTQGQSTINFKNTGDRIQYETKSQSKENSYTTKTSDKTNMNIDSPIQRETDVRDDILRVSLKFIDEHGWTIDAIRAGIRASNQPSTIEGLFSNGYDLVDYFQRDATAKMSVYMKEQAKKGETQGVRFLLDGLKYRLGLIIPYAKTWGQAMAQDALPQNVMHSWKNLFDLSSEAWYSAGDTSTDTNWYTKRLLLATVYKSTEIYMLQDQSQGKIDTMNFLERRLNDFQTLSSVRTTISKSLSDTAQITNGLFSVIRNLTTRR